MVIGPESTGKSTLSKALAENLNTVWVQEYAREYLENKGRAYQEKDLLEMAKGQIHSEDHLIAQANKYLICDTDLYVYKVWSEHAYHQCHSWILEQIAIRHYDLYLLTDIDIPWVEDPLREHSNPYWRSYFYNQYKDIVSSSGVPWGNVNGTEDERLSTALKLIRANFDYLLY